MAVITPFSFIAPEAGELVNPVTIAIANEVTLENLWHCASERFA
jgi:hypothetical protein